MWKALCVLTAAPLLAQQGAEVYSVEKEKALGRQVAADVRGRAKPFDNAEVGSYVERIGHGLIAGIAAARFDYKFEVLAATHATEPFAVPGGHVFVPAQALLAAADEAEFAGMLAHAIGHIELRHGTRAATRGVVLNQSTVPLIFMGGVSAAHADVRNADLAIPKGFLAIQREQELEADRFGLELMSRAGYDPAAYQRYVERSHPAGSAALPPREVRAARIREAVGSLPSTARPGSNDEFRRTQQIVRSLTP